MARHARYNYSSATRAALQLSWSAGGRVRFWHMHPAGKLANMGGNRTGCAALLLLLACGRETAAKHADDIPRANTGGNPRYVARAGSRLCLLRSWQSARTSSRQAFPT